MPTNKKKGRKSTPANRQFGDKKCNFCHETKSVKEFYVSGSPIHSVDRRVPICKECIEEVTLNENWTINFLELNRILKQIDRPYYKDMLESAFNSFENNHPYMRKENIKFHGKEILGLYFKLIAMRHDINKSYDASEEEGFFHRSSTLPASKKREIDAKFPDIRSQGKRPVIDYSTAVPLGDDDPFEDDSDTFVVTDEIRDLFGEGFDIEEYKKMYKKYEKLKMNYSLQTSLHQEALATYVRFKVKEEAATADGKVDEAKKWYDAAQNAAERAKLTPRQLSEADLHGGINSFSEIFRAVEQAVDIVPILPSFKHRPNDACDFIIWCYINYARELHGLPQCSYEDVYKFYDKKKAEYIAQYGDPYGIFEDDPTEELRPSVKKFITLPKEYEDGDE